MIILDFSILDDFPLEPIALPLIQTLDDRIQLSDRSH